MKSSLHPDSLLRAGIIESIGPTIPIQRAVVTFYSPLFKGN